MGARCVDALPPTYSPILEGAPRPEAFTFSAVVLTSRSIRRIAHKQGNTCVLAGTDPIHPGLPLAVHASPTGYDQRGAVQFRASLN
jgi:hypothetical protein